MSTNTVILKTTEVCEYEWELEVPDHIDPDDGDAVWHWANENELLTFDDPVVDQRESHVEGVEPEADEAMKVVTIYLSEGYDYSWSVHVPAHLKGNFEMFEWAEANGLVQRDEGRPDNTVFELVVEELTS